MPENESLFLTRNILSNSGYEPSENRFSQNYSVPESQGSGFFTSLSNINWSALAEQGLTLGVDYYAAKEKAKLNNQNVTSIIQPNTPMLSSFNSGSISGNAINMNIILIIIGLITAFFILRK